MNESTLSQIIGKTDIYIIDQIMKERYQPLDTILDAGCGEGRNLTWFYVNGFDISGVDTDAERLDNAKLRYPKMASNFQLGNLEALPFGENKFHHVICSAVLHFAQSEKHFHTMFSELVRVLKIDGTLFIRVASDIGLDGRMPYLKESQTNREGTFFITREIIQELSEKHSLALIEPIKTTNVQDVRAMTTLVYRKLN